MAPRPEARVLDRLTATAGVFGRAVSCRPAANGQMEELLRIFMDRASIPRLVGFLGQQRSGQQPSRTARSAGFSKSQRLAPVSVAQAL